MVACRLRTTDRWPPTSIIQHHDMRGSKNSHKSGRSITHCRWTVSLKQPNISTYVVLNLPSWSSTSCWEPQCLVTIASGAPYKRTDLLTDSTSCVRETLIATDHVPAAAAAPETSSPEFQGCAGYRSRNEQRGRHSLVFGTEFWLDQADSNNIPPNTHIHTHANFASQIAVSYKYLLKQQSSKQQSRISLH